MKNAGGSGEEEDFEEGAQCVGPGLCSGTFFMQMLHANLYILVIFLALLAKILGEKILSPQYFY